MRTCGQIYYPVVCIKAASAGLYEVIEQWRDKRDWPLRRHTVLQGGMAYEDARAYVRRLRASGF